MPRPGRGSGTWRHRARGERCGARSTAQSSSEIIRPRERTQRCNMKTMDGESVATSVVTTGDESLERPNAIRLDSWKDIANYLNRSVRTVQRWEIVEAMPVHRHCHGTGGSVYAYSHEVDAWRSGRSQKKPLAPRVSAFQSAPLGSLA